LVGSAVNVNQLTATNLLGTTNYSTLTGSTVNAFQVIAQGQIKSVGSGSRTLVPTNTFTTPYNFTNLSAVSFLYIYNNNNQDVTLNISVTPDWISHFGEHLYVQLDNDLINSNLLTFGDNFKTISGGRIVPMTRYMLHFICDGYNMIEVSRSQWA